MARLRWITTLLFVALVGVLLALPEDASSQVCSWSRQCQRTSMQIPNRACAPPLHAQMQPRLQLPQFNLPRLQVQLRPPCQTQVQLQLQFQPRLPQISLNLRVPSRPILLQQVPVRPNIPTFTARCTPQPRLQVPQLPPRTVLCSRPPIQTQVALQPRLPQINLRTALTPRIPQVPLARLPRLPQMARPQPQIPSQSAPAIPQLRMNRPHLPPPVFAQRPHLTPPVLAQRPNLPNLLIQQPTLPNLLLLQRPTLPTLVMQRPSIPTLPLMLRQPNLTLPLPIQPAVQLPTMLARLPVINQPALPVALPRPDTTSPNLPMFLARPLPERESAPIASPGEQRTPAENPVVARTSTPRTSTADTALDLNLLALERPELTTGRRALPRSSTPSLLETLRGSPTFTVAVRESLDRPALPGLPPTVLQRNPGEEPGEPEPTTDPELPLDHPSVQPPATSASARPARSEVNLPLPPTVLAR